MRPADIAQASRQRSKTSVGSSDSNSGRGGINRRSTALPARPPAPSSRIGDDLQASGPDLMAYRPRAARMCRRGPDNIARRTHYLAAEAVTEFDTSELTTGMTAGAKRHGRPPPLLVGHQHSRTRKVAPRSSWLSNSSLIKRSRGSTGVGGYRFEPGDYAGATGLHVGIRRHLLL
jgi:hypothetical protein